jgi:hypothetical protein
VPLPVDARSAEPQGLRVTQGRFMKVLRESVRNGRDGVMGAALTGGTHRDSFMRCQLPFSVLLGLYDGSLESR